MGLDTVELIMSAEEAFDIDLPDEETSRVRTVGDFHALVMEKLRAKNLAEPGAEVVMDRLRSLICRQLGVKPGQVTPEARFREDLRAG
jgi:acyl carrier protein